MEYIYFYSPQNYCTENLAPAPNDILVWSQYTYYGTGDKVYYPTRNDSVYESLINYNVWSPECYPAGWRLVE